MSQHFSPKIVSNGLVLCYDAANIKSFKGIPGTNTIPVINYSSSNTDGANFKYRQITENVTIPLLGSVPAKAAYIYNNYNGGVAPTSGNCCPNLFYFFNTINAVSASTTYTYAIIYKTITGYTNGNIMYRYEYNSSDVYVTEGGVHSNSNRVSLGDGWWYAWGQFTTSATTAYLRPYLFHYEYATNNTVYVANVSITAGTYVYPPQHMPKLGEVRGSTVSTGGGVIDLSGRGSLGELVNTPSFSSDNRGSFSFNGTNQIIIATENSALNTQTPTVEVWVKTNALSQNGFFFEKGNVNTQYSLFQEGGNIVWRTMGLSDQSMYATTSTYMSTSSWAHIVGTYESGTKSLYINGVRVNNSTGVTGTIGTNANGISIGAYGGYNGSRGYYYNGEIGVVRVYNRSLSASEISQNFAAGRGRYGV